MCYRCDTLAVTFINTSVNMASSVPSHMEPVCSEHDPYKIRMAQWSADGEERPGVEVLTDALANMTTSRDSALRRADRVQAQVERMQPVVEAARLHANDATPVGHLRAALATFDKAQQADEAAT